MDQDQHQLFVYGSLRNGFHHEAHKYISRYFSFVCNGKIKGQLSDLGDYPAATPCTDDRFIVGELYVIKDVGELDWAMEQLDEYEGLFPETDEGEQVLFRREMTEIFGNDGSIRNAWVYWYNGDVAGRPVIKSGDLMQYIEEKYKKQ